MKSESNIDLILRERKEILAQVADRLCENCAEHEQFKRELESLVAKYEVPKSKHAFEGIAVPTRPRARMADNEYLLKPKRGFFTQIFG